MIQNASILDKNCEKIHIFLETLIEDNGIEMLLCAFEESLMVSPMCSMWAYHSALMRWISIAHLKGAQSISKAVTLCLDCALAVFKDIQSTEDVVINCISFLCIILKIRPSSIIQHKNIYIFLQKIFYSKNDINGELLKHCDRLVKCVLAACCSFALSFERESRAKSAAAAVQLSEIIQNSDFFNFFTKKSEKISIFLSVLSTLLYDVFQNNEEYLSDIRQYLYKNRHIWHTNDFYIFDDDGAVGGAVGACFMSFLFLSGIVTEEETDNSVMMNFQSISALLQASLANAAQTNDTCYRDSHILLINSIILNTPPSWSLAFAHSIFGQNSSLQSILSPLLISRHTGQNTNSDIFMSETFCLYFILVISAGPMWLNFPVWMPNEICSLLLEIKDDSRIFLSSLHIHIISILSSTKTINYPKKCQNLANQMAGDRTTNDTLEDSERFDFSLPQKDENRNNETEMKILSNHPEGVSLFEKEHLTRITRLITEIHFIKLINF
eukprot:GHVL01035472.1.p1 GENE.GHVL01035472.1~~GHVL01035472.1.p1  ORF type:complete len:534 (+),score=111.03 GHVL01035472.1:113-1603(+)